MPKINTEEMDEKYFELPEEAFQDVPNTLIFEPFQQAFQECRSLVVNRQDIENIVERITAATQKVERVKAVRNMAVRSAESELNQLNFLFAKVVEQYVKVRTEETGESRILLDGAVLKSTNVKARPEVEDADVLLKHLESNPQTAELISSMFGSAIKKVVSGSAIIGYVKKTGEILPGVKMTDDRKSVGISVPGAGKNGASLSIKLNTTAKLTFDDGSDEETEEMEP